jgi:hypothetical protein
MSTATEPSSSHRRRLQFRLRTLLAAMLLVCLGLTFWSVYIRPYRQEARIIAQLQEHGAVLTTETEGPAWLRAIAGDEFFRRIVKAELSDPRVVDEDLRLLTGAPRLRQLMIDAPGRITSEGLRNLAAMSSLEHFTLVGPTANDEGLRRISQAKQLESLHLLGPFTDRGLSHLGNLPELRVLVLVSPHLTDEGLSSLGAMQTLRRLNIQAPITDAGMRRLAGLENLQALFISGDPAKAGLLGALESRTQYEFIDVPLIDAVEYFSDVHQIPIRLDGEELRAAGRDPLTPVTGTGGGPLSPLPGMNTNEHLRDALARICAGSHMDYIISNDEIIITTPEAAAESRPELRPFSSN